MLISSFLCVEFCLFSRHRVKLCETRLRRGRSSTISRLPVGKLGFGAVRGFILDSRAQRCVDLIFFRTAKPSSLSDLEADDGFAKVASEASFSKFTLDRRRKVG